jgi:hypothetical protein
MPGDDEYMIKRTAKFVTYHPALHNDLQQCSQSRRSNKVGYHVRQNANSNDQVENHCLYHHTDSAVGTSLSGLSRVTLQHPDPENDEERGEEVEHDCQDDESDVCTIDNIAILLIQAQSFGNETACCERCCSELAETHEETLRTYRYPVYQSKRN